MNILNIMVLIAITTSTGGSVDAARFYDQRVRGAAADLVNRPATMARMLVRQDPIYDWARGQASAARNRDRDSRKDRGEGSGKSPRDDRTAKAGGGANGKGDRDATEADSGHSGKAHDRANGSGRKRGGGAKQ